MLVVRELLRVRRAIKQAGAKRCVCVCVGREVGVCDGVERSQRDREVHPDRLSLPGSAGYLTRRHIHALLPQVSPPGEFAGVAELVTRAGALPTGPAHDPAPRPWPSVESVGGWKVYGVCESVGE